MLILRNVYVCHLALISLPSWESETMTLPVVADSDIET